MCVENFSKISEINFYIIIINNSIIFTYELMNYFL